MALTKVSRGLLSTSIVDNGNATAITIDSSENVGIGTSSPAKLLDVAGAIRAINSAGSSAAEIDITSGGTWRFRSNPTTGTNSYGLDIVKGSAGTDVKMSINSSGNVGIGTSSPDRQLSVNSFSGNGTVSINASTTGAGTLYFADGNTGTSIYTGFIQYNHSENAMQFATNGGNERMRIDSSGNVGIGTDSPSAKLHIAGSPQATNGALVFLRNDAATTSNTTFGGVHFSSSPGTDFSIGKANVNTATSLSFRNGNSGASLMDLDSSGNLLVGKTSDSNTSNGVALRPDGGARFTSSGTSSFVQLAFFRNGSASEVGSITTTSSATAYNTSSDYRLKENVVAMSGATDRLKQLKPSRFNFIADADTTVDGFLAHEVQDIVPEAITGTKDAVDADGNPDYQGIDQSKLVPLLVATIQELEARLTALENT